MNRAEQSKLLGRGAALMLALVPATLWAQQNPGLSAKPSGRSLAEPSAPPAEQPIDLSRPNPQTTLQNSSAEELFLDAAMRGEAWAQTKLGKFYIEQSDDPERQQKGIELLQSAAAQKDAEATYLLATFAATVIGGQTSSIAALEKLQEAARLGSADAQYKLASFYAEGLGVEKDTAQAEMWARKAALQGHDRAQFLAGRILLENGENSRKTEALEFLQTAADAGNIDSVLFLASSVGNGRFGLQKDEARAEALLKPWAEQGNADCQFVLAALYKFGDSYADRREEAYVWMQRAANQGHGRAVEILAAEQK
jgi:enhanced entry protein LpnE